MNIKIAGLMSFLALISGTVCGDFRTSFSEGRQAVSQKQFDLAIQKYGEAAKQTSIPGQRYQALFAMANAYGMKGEWEKAEEIILQILNDKNIPAKNRMSAQVFLGDCKLKQKKIADAAAAYQKVSAYGIRNNESYYALLSCGNLYGQLKKFDEAKKCYQTLIDDPNADSARKNRAKVGMGNILFNQGKCREAVSLLTSIAADTGIPANLRADAFTGIARSQYKMKAYKDAYDADLAILALDGIPAYFKASAYMQAITIQGGIFRNYALAKKLLNDFKKMPGLNAAQKKWITNYRAKIRKDEHTL
jgi:tetratricopeptide (TPR) repeat protein